MRGLRFVAAGVLVAGLVVVVGAQPGGFGFGGGFRTSPAFLVQNKAVQEELKMTDDQVEKVKDWGKDFGAKSIEMYKDAGIEFGKGGFGKKLDPEEVEKRDAVRHKINKVAYEELGKILKPEQVKRLHQVQYQAEGPAAFQDPDVVSALKLTDSQKSTVKGVIQDFNKDAAEFRPTFGKKGGGGFDKEKMAENQKKIAKLEKEAVSKVEETLTADQKKTWKDLTGAPFDTTKLNTGFGGFGKNKKDKE